MKCPYCNEYENDNPGSIIAHAVGKSDSTHKGLAYQEVQAKVEGETTDDEPQNESKQIEDDDEQADNQISAFDAPETTGDVRMSEDDDMTLQVVAGQTLRGTDGNHYETEAGDSIAEDGEVQLVGGQTVQTVSGEYVETEAGDYLQ